MPYKVLTKGFTLIETIVGIVVLAISFSLISNFIYPVVEHSADQLHQIRAAELGQSILNEIQNKAFDENSDKTGGIYRCGEDYDKSGIIEPDEQCSTNMGADDSEIRSKYDDVDDYNNLILSSSDIANSLGEKLGEQYQGFTVEIIVCNDSDYDGITQCLGDSDDNNYTAKLITVTVTTPTGFEINFSTYRANF